MASILAVPGGVSAQSFHLFHADLRADGAGIGSLADASVRVVGFPQPEMATLAYRGQAIDLRAQVMLAEDRTALAAGVGRRTTLQTGGAHRIDAMPRTWARVVGGSAAGAEIALPAGLPVARATIPSGSPRVRGKPRSHQGLYAAIT